MTKKSRSAFNLLLLGLALCLTFPAYSASLWKCKDGTGSTTVADSGSSKLDGVIDDSGKCTWGREDDRGFFLMFKNGGCVLLPGAKGKTFPKGFEIELFFSCDLEAIGSTGFAGLFASGGLYEDGISIMVNKEGAVLVNLNGLTQHYYGLVPTTNIPSKKDTRLRVRYDLECVRLWVNGNYLTSYPTKGRIAFKPGDFRLGSLSNYPFTGNLYEARLRDLAVDPDDAEDAPPMTELEKLQNYKGPKYDDPEGTVMITDFKQFSPKELIVTGNVPVADKYVYRLNASFWPQGVSTMLYPPSDLSQPNIYLDPKLKGRYDVYICVRSTASNSIAQVLLGEQYYRIRTTGLGEKHRSYELLLARNVEMENNKLGVGPGNNAYVGFFKLIPSSKGRVNEVFDPAGSIEPAGRITSKDTEELSRITHEELFRSGVIRERIYVETRPAGNISPASETRGYQLFPRNWMELLFPVSVPEKDIGTLSLNLAAAPGEYEPVSFGIRGLRKIQNITLSAGNWKDANGNPAQIELRIGVVEYLLKRLTSYSRNGEVMKAPLYIEKTTTIPELNAQESRQFWLTVHVPQGTRPGKYHCQLTLTDSTRKESIPLNLEVYPFQLDKPSVCYSFYGFPSEAKDEVVLAAMQDFSAHGMNMLYIDEAMHVIAFKGNSPQTAAIDWSKARMPFFMDNCKKYGLDKCFILAIESIYTEAAKYSTNAPAVFERFMKDIEAKRQAMGWPTFYYMNCDEPLSNPDNLPTVLTCSKVMAKLGLRQCNDHLWYKTARPYQKECDQIAPVCQLFINRFNTSNLWYVDTWQEMQARCKRENKLLMAYNSNNAIVFSQPAAARFSYGWFHRTAGADTCGHIMYTYKESYGSPYDDLDGNCTDWLCNYPQWDDRKGGPSLDWESYREGVDDMRYIVTLENRLAEAKRKGINVTAEQQILSGLLHSFDLNRFYKESTFITPKWDKSWNADGKYYASGSYNVPNGWTIANYDSARQKIAQAIIAIDRKLNKH